MGSVSEVQAAYLLLQHNLIAEAPTTPDEAATMITQYHQDKLVPGIAAVVGQKGVYDALQIVASANVLLKGIELNGHRATT